MNKNFNNVEELDDQFDGGFQRFKPKQGSQTKRGQKGRNRHKDQRRQKERERDGY